MPKEEFVSKIPNNWTHYGGMDLSTPEKRQYWRSIEDATLWFELMPGWKKALAGSGYDTDK